MAVKKMKANIRKISLPDNSALAEVNNNEAGKAFAAVLASQRELTSTRMEIALKDIRLNPDNAIFNVNDAEEDTVRLAEDIKRNGLLHNLVVFPLQENGKTVYMLLSGERRYKALDYLQKQGDAKWNIVKGCNVVTSALSDNEKKVLLYSANLQVRGGFGDEKIRRKAGSEFIACLQKEPYNLSETDAKKALKEISITTGKQIDRDVRIENELNNDLREMLDAGFLTRRECDIYVRFESQKQEQIASACLGLMEANCKDGNGNPVERLEKERKEIHYDLVASIDRAAKELDADKMDEALALAVEECNASVAMLNEYASNLKKDAEQVSTSEDEELNKKLAIQQVEKKVAKKKSANEITFVEKSLLPITDKITKKIESKSYQKGLKAMKPERRDKDIAMLDELIRKATELKAMIEGAE